MAIPYPPPPERPDPLSPREQRILAGIEDELHASDPDLIDNTIQDGSADLPGPSRSGLTLAGAVIVLVLALAAIPAVWRVGMGLVLLFVVLPWVLLQLGKRDEP